MGAQKAWYIFSCTCELPGKIFSSNWFLSLTNSLLVLHSRCLHRCTWYYWYQSHAEQGSSTRRRAFTWKWWGYFCHSSAYLHSFWWIGMTNDYVIYSTYTYCLILICSRWCWGRICQTRCRWANSFSASVYGVWPITLWEGCHLYF